MPKVRIINGGFQDIEGNALASGYLLMQLSQDCQASTGEVCAGITVKVPLDTNGNVSGTVLIWPNDVLTPSNNYYTVRGYTASGELSWGPNVQQVLSNPSPFDLNAWIPNQVTNWTPGNLGNESVQHNGTLVGTRPTINVIDGVGIALTVADSAANNRVDVTVGSASSLGGFAYGGDGSDSVVSFDGTATYPNFSTTSGVAPNLTYLLTYDVHATTLTVAAGITVKARGWRIFAQNAMTISGTVSNVGLAGGIGGNAAGATGGTAGASGTDAVQITQSLCKLGLSTSSLPAPGKTGANGGTGVGTAGTTGGAPGEFLGTNSFAWTLTDPSVNGSAGGNGGASGGNGGGAGGAGGPKGGAPNTGIFSPRAAEDALYLFPQSPNALGNPFVIAGINGGGGSGGAGAGDGANAGGGGGGSGAGGGNAGGLLLASPNITIAATGTVTVAGQVGGNGGNGANGVAGNAGGGGGGAGGPGGTGGIVVLIYRSLLNLGSLLYGGGVGGVRGTHGNGVGTGSNGLDGVVGPTGNTGLLVQLPQ